MTTTLIARARALSKGKLTSLSRRWNHVQGVARTATEVAPVVAPAEAESIIAAAWLHDVGYGPDIALTGFHPLDGARFAQASGMPALVVALIAHHTGAETEADERGLRAELAAFAAPPRDILDVLTFADLTTSPDGESISAQDRVAGILLRYPVGDSVFAAVSRSAPDLLASVARVQERLDAARATARAANAP